MTMAFEQIRAELNAILGSNGLLIGDDVRHRSDSWTGRGKCQALAIALPVDTAQVAAVVRLCHQAGIAVVSQGGKTGLVEGCQTHGEELVVSLERMNAIESCDQGAGTMTVQAGAPLQLIQEQARALGLMYPVDLGSRGSCTIGGNIATNAGGIRVIRYGMTRQQVLGLEVVLADGSVLDSMNCLLKNNTGYDLKQLFIGSEGTLGIVTRAVLRLQPQPLSEQVAILAVPTFEALTTLLRRSSEWLGGQLSAFEVMWQSHYQAVAIDSGKHKPPLAGHHPYYVIVEALGGDPEHDPELFEKAMERALEQGLAEDVIIAQSGAQAAAIWAIREDVPAVIMAMMPPISFDISLPLEKMEGFVEKVTRILREHWREKGRVLVFGHLGDGNLHVIVTVGEDSPEIRHRVESLVYAALKEAHGSVSAEHGIGLEKKSYLELCRNAGELALMRLLKRTLDPTDMFNPGKLL